jgi:DNA repair exonuclease SbcCD ATPase subunit
MAQNPQFLQEFQASMDKLNGMNQTIQDSLKQKKEFSDKLVAKLKDINQKIKDLAGQINKLKTTLDGLQGQVNNNSASINDKDKKIAELTQQITTLEGEKQQIAQQLADLQKKCNDDSMALQQKIDAGEAQIRKLTEDNDALKKQTDALTAELSGKGDLQNQHAEELKKIQAENQAKIDGLLAQIKDCDDKMLELQKQLKDKTDEAAAHAKSITDTQTQGQAQIEQLNRQIEELKSDNNGLIQRIIEATQAINKATENLEILANSVPNQQSEQYINQLFSEIEQSIQQISNILQGSNVPASPQVQPQPANAKPWVNDTNKRFSSGDGGRVTLPFSGIIKRLDENIQKGDTKKNWAEIKQKLLDANSADEVQSIINNYRLSFTANYVAGTKRRKMKHGGKKTKHMKQKGGFKYRTNTKRRSIVTSSRSKSSKLA